MKSGFDAAAKNRGNAAITAFSKFIMRPDLLMHVRSQIPIASEK